MIRVQSLIVIFTTWQVVSSVCYTEAGWSTLNYWREPTSEDSLNRYMKTNYPSLTYDIHNGIEEQYYYLTTFYLCPDGYAYISTKVETGTHYVANKVGTDSYGDLVSTCTSPCSDDECLFRYGGDDAMDSVNLRSYANSNHDYLAGVHPSAIKLRSQLFWWWAVPYLTSESFGNRNAQTTGLRSSLRIRNQQYTIGIRVGRRGGRSQLDVRPISASTNPFQFEMIKYRIYTERTYQGRVAVVLRSSPTDYLAVSVTRDLKVSRPLVYRRNGMRYNRIGLVAYNDVLRSQNSPIVKPDIRDQNVIDERFFEVVKQRDGTNRLRSMLNKDLYVAVARFPVRSRRRSELIIAPLTNQTRSIINYNFRMSNTDAPPSVRRLPNFRSNQFAPR